MTSNPYESPQTAGQSPEQLIGSWGPTLLKALAVVGIVVLLVALLLPATRSAREPARRTECRNKLKQIALAMHNYEQEYHSLPPAYTVDADGKPLHSWRTLILPYIEQQQLYDTIDLSKPWDDPVNKAAFETIVPAYRCPSATCPKTHTHYLAIIAPDGCFQGIRPRKFSEITDDHDFTLLAVEVPAGQAVHWMSPTDTTESRVTSTDATADLPHRGLAQAACLSGGVIVVRVGTKPAKLRALVSAAGNDDAIASAED